MNAMPPLSRLFSATLFLLSCNMACGAEVIGIVDGDTFDALVNGKEQRFRLAQIDTPERGQPFGKQAKQALSDLAYGKQCDITEVDQDRYERIVAQVVCDGVDVNRTMVRTGYAWVFTQYVTDQTYFADEQRARANKLGLWADPHSVPPWEWRKERKSKSKKQP